MLILFKKIMNYSFKMIINYKEYPDNGFFKERYTQEYCNLKIYPLVGILEREAGLLSDFAEELNNNCNCLIYGEPEIEVYQVFNDKLLNFNKKIITTSIQSVDNNCINFLWNNSSNTEILNGVTNYDVIVTQNNEYCNKYFDFKIKLSNSDKILYINKYHTIFKKAFYYYFEFDFSINKDSLNYDNLICYTMIIKNGGNLLRQVLTENLNIIDRWCILDTGSTDGSQDVIREVLAHKKGKLYEEPFLNFRDSRNRCIELAGKMCKYIIMLDDTYVVKNDSLFRTFLNEVRGDQFADSFSMVIQSNDNEYYSNRIIKSDSNLRYIYKIHEVINPKNNKNVNVPDYKSKIFDYRADYMEKRTNERKKYDLDILFDEYIEDPDDPRYLYYIAQTYSCMDDEFNKAKYFELRMNHPVEGYIQEKIDAIFELARTYNFKVSPITKKKYPESLNNNYTIKEDEWNICENLYIKAWELDKNRPDSLYFIGIYYYIKGNYKKAYDYLRLGFEIGYPIESQYSLKPTLSYYFLPKFLTEICYHMNDSILGEQACDLFLSNGSNKDSLNLMMSWKQIHNNINNFSSISKGKLKNKFDKPVFCIVTNGGWSKWTCKDILTRGLGGSETWVIETATHIKKNNDYYVVVFCNTDTTEDFKDVGYNPIELFPHFVANNVVDYCIISRYPEYIPVALLGGVNKVSIIFHDIVIPETVITDSERLTAVIGLTDWHCEHIKNTFPILKNKVHKLNYGINTDAFEYSTKQKVKNSFIYSSFANRGLVVVLRMWKRIKTRLTDATLHIYCDVDHEWVKKNYPAQYIEIKQLLKELLDYGDRWGVSYWGWVNKKVLTEAWTRAEYWLYPCIFEETYCMTAMEAAISRTLVITNGLAALGETVGDRGLIVPGNPLTPEWEARALEKLFECNSVNIEKLVEKNWRWAMERDWGEQSVGLGRVCGGW